MNDILNQFELQGEVLSVQPYGNGHINDTFLVKTTDVPYILQKMNESIFPDTEHLMDNVVKVTTYLRARVKLGGGDPDREAMQVILTKDRKHYWRDETGACWRMYRFIDGLALDAPRTPADFYESAVAFGRFQSLLADYPADTLHEIIPNFHHTGKRFETFCKAVEEDVCGRAASVQQEIAFVMARKADTTLITDRLAAGKLPLRVTHNDTKLNNVMLDADTGKGLCVLDLDTVMSGSALYDFGDSIRFGANTAAEDETDLSKVSLDLELFEWYVKGYLKGCNGSLTPLEIELLPVGAKLMTLECGMRFLTDYLQGDTYFKIHREHHNLDRCRTQLKLVKDMEDKWDEMHRIVRNCV